MDTVKVYKHSYWDSPCYDYIINDAKLILLLTIFVLL